MLDHVRGQFLAFFSTLQFPVRLRLDRSLTISVALATMNNNFVARSFASFAKHFFYELVFTGFDIREMLYH